MELDKIQQEQADALRQEKIINDFLHSRPRRKRKMQEPKPRQAVLLSSHDSNSEVGCEHTASSQRFDSPKPKESLGSRRALY